MNIATKLAVLSDRFAVCMLKRPQIAHEGLSILGLRTLALVHFSDQPPTMKQLASQLGVRLPSASVIVDKLEHEGYVERHHEDSDKRIIRVHLTGKSQNFLKHHRDQRLSLMTSALDQLSLQEQQAVIRFFENCIKIAEKQD